MSWVSDLFTGLTARQAKLLHQFVDCSELGEQYFKLAIDGCDWIHVEWIGRTSDDKATHCRILADGDQDTIDVVLTVQQITTIVPELKSELSRAFDKPAQSIFRRSDRA